MYCENCGNQLPESAKYCPNCGIEISNDITSFQDIEISSNNRSILSKFAILLFIAVIVLTVVLCFLPHDHKNEKVLRYNHSDNWQVSSDNTDISDTDLSDTDPSEMNENMSVDDTSTDQPASIESGSAYYTSATNSKLSALPGTAMVIINGEEYTVDDNRMILNYADCVSGMTLAIDDKYEIYASLLGLHDEMCEGFKTSDFTSYTTYLTLSDFYDSTEVDEDGFTNYFARTLLSNGTYDKVYFDTTDLVVEKYDTSGITALYFNIITISPTSGKRFDIEIFSVSDYSNAEPASKPDVCFSCGGTGTCFNCSGSGRKQYYNAVTHSMNSKNCTVCQGTGICNTCYGSGKP